jgi:hypothetical protein
MNPNTKTTYKPVCFYCGRHHQDMRPVVSRWGAWHVCRVCDVRASLGIAERRAETERRRGEL